MYPVSIKGEARREEGERREMKEMDLQERREKIEVVSEESR